MHYEPVTGPGVWYGRELARREHWIRHFTPHDLDEVAAAVHAFQKTGAGAETLRPGNFPLPRLGPVLREVLGELLEGRGFILLRGLPVERMTREEQAIAYLGLGSWLGRFRSQNAKGHLLGHVKDLGLDIRDSGVRYYQTNRKLEYHTDSVDVVGLLCLQAAKAGGESYLASSMTVYNEILKKNPDLLAALFQPFATDRRGEVPEGMKPWFDIPMFHRHAGRLSCIYVRQYIESAQRNFPEARRLTPGQREAMDLVDELCNDPAIHLSMDFRPGDIQLLHNHQILHSRGDFENWPEPERHRHLLRLWVAPPEARSLPEVFAPRYGSVTPGERGGIVVKGTTFKVPLEAE
jgi:TfdA family taurine catabolism dioxygenase TauD